MPLKLVPPGTRKGNPWYLVRGTICGERFEVSTKTKDKAVAERFKAELEHRIQQSRVPGAGEEVSFARAAELYAAWRDPDIGDRKRIDRLSVHFGQRDVAGIQQADLVEAARILYPQGVNATLNRGVIKPAAAILHYAARNKWCPWLRIERFREPPPKTRASNTATRDALLAALREEEAAARQALAKLQATARGTGRRVRTRGAEAALRRARKKRLLILWLFHHWNRVSDPLRLTWDDHIDLRAKTYLLYVGKTRQWRVKPIAEEVFEALANEPEEARKGRLFPWARKESVYNWLRPLCQRLGVKFTPHMARHYGGTVLNRAGAGLKTTMSALDHSDPASSMRYQDADIEVVREAFDRVRALPAQTPAAPIAQDAPAARRENRRK